jgi:hypothetical protein
MILGFWREGHISTALDFLESRAIPLELSSKQAERQNMAFDLVYFSRRREEHKVDDSEFWGPKPFPSN